MVHRLMWQLPVGYVGRQGREPITDICTIRDDGLQGILDRVSRVD
jgi:hypothetical protein